jgi:hypothetical protein
MPCDGQLMQYESEKENLQPCLVRKAMMEVAHRIIGARARS